MFISLRCFFGGERCEANTTDRVKVDGRRRLPSQRYELCENEGAAQFHSTRECLVKARSLALSVTPLLQKGTCVIYTRLRTEEWGRQEEAIPWKLWEIKLGLENFANSGKKDNVAIKKDWEHFPNSNGGSGGKDPPP